MQPCVYCRILYSSQDMEATTVPIKRVDKKDVVHIYSGIYLNKKKN